MKLSSLLLLSVTLISQYTKSHKLNNSNKVNDPDPNYNPSIIQVVETEFEKPILDDSEYRVIILPNGLEVILVSDPLTSVAASSVSVSVGSRYDPKEFPGMAHLCEHLLFMGTEKYPKDDEYFIFVNSHGGSYNAFTSLGFTTYSSEINPAYHLEQLDRMANFFIKPLFTEDVIQLETHSVNSEFNNYRTQVSRARYQLLNYAYKNTSFFSVFTTGNRQTLFSGPRANNKSVKEGLHAFFAEYYRPRNMKAAIYGNQSLDILQEWVFRTFGQIPDTGKKDINDVNPLSVIERQHFWYYYPKTGPSLLMVFIVPSAGVHYKSVPTHYLNYLFSQSGPNSPRHYLSRKGLAFQIQFSDVPYSPKYDFLFVSVGLQPLGDLFLSDVIREVFSCIKFYKENGTNREIFDELMTIQNNQFKYSFKSDPFKYTGELAGALMLETHPRKYLIKRYVIREYDQNEFDEFFSALDVDNFVSFALTYAKFNETEPFYNVSFTRHTYTESFLETIKNIKPAPLGYPPRNAYIPTNYMVTMPILNNTEVKPTILRKTALSILWYKYGSFFYCPFGVIRILLRNPYVSMTQSNFLKFRFLRVYLYSILPIDSFYFAMAGLDFNISLLTQGVVLFFYGYTQRIMQIYNKIILLFKHLSINYEQFGRFKSVVLSSIKSRILSSPIGIVENEFNDILYSENPPLVDLINLVDELDHFTINSFFYHFLSSLHFDIFVSGNIPPQDALHILYMLEAVFSPHPLRLSQYTDTRVLTLENGSDYFYAQELIKPEARSAVLVYFEGAKINELKKSFLVYILYLIMRGPLFSQLRTKEQLGYTIKSRVKASGTIIGYVITLQSERQPHILHSRVDAFINSAYEILRNMTPEEFNYYLEGYDTVFQTRPLTILSETYNIWLDIIDRTHTFFTEVYQKGIGHVTLQDAIDLYQEMFFTAKRRISYYAYSSFLTDMYNVFDLPLDKLSEFFSTKGEEISKEDLHEYVLLSTNIADFHDKLVIQLSANKDNNTVKSLINDTFIYLSKLYYGEKMDFLTPIALIDDITYFKANSSLSPTFIHSSLWDKFY